jgi:hypothetical protein
MTVLTDVKLPTYAEAVKQWEDRNHGRTRNVDPVLSPTTADGLPEFRLANEGRIWVDGEFTPKEMLALVVISQMQFALEAEENPEASSSHGRKENVMSVFQDDGKVVSLIALPDNQNFIVRTRGKGKQISESSVFDDVMQAEDCFKETVRKLITDPLRADAVDELAVLRLAGGVLTLMKYNEDDEFIILQELDHRATVLERTYDESKAWECYWGVIGKYVKEKVPYV